MELRLSLSSLIILSRFLVTQGIECTGADLIKQTDLPSGTVYPILLRFERMKVVESHWEAGDPKVMGRPRRRFYRLTGTGKALATAALQKLPSLPDGVLTPERG